MALDDNAQLFAITAARNAVPPAQAREGECGVPVCINPLFFFYSSAFLRVARAQALTFSKQLSLILRRAALQPRALFVPL